MRIKEKHGRLFIDTDIYQACNGAIFMNWGNTVMKLEKDYAEYVAYDIPNFSVEDFNKYYKNN